MNSSNLFLFSFWLVPLAVSFRLPQRFWLSSMDHWPILYFLQIVLLSQENSVWGVWQSLTGWLSPILALVCEITTISNLESSCCSIMSLVSSYVLYVFHMVMVICHQGSIIHCLLLWCVLAKSYIGNARRVNLCPNVSGLSVLRVVPVWASCPIESFESVLLFSMGLWLVASCTVLFGCPRFKGFGYRQLIAKSMP